MQFLFYFSFFIPLVEGIMCFRKGVENVQDWFWEFTKKSISNREATFFWHDSWIGGKYLLSDFLECFLLSTQKNNKVSQMGGLMKSGVGILIGGGIFLEGRNICWVSY